MNRAGVVVLLVLATLLWTVGIVAVWAQRQMLDTQNWVQTSDRPARGRQPQRPEGARQRRCADGLEKANRAAHQSLLKVLNGDVARGGTVTLNLHDLIAQGRRGHRPATRGCRSAAGEPPAAAGAQDRQDRGRAEALQTAKRLIIVIIVVAVLLMAGAIALSTDRRRTVIACGGCVLFAGVAVLALRRIGGDVAVNALAEAPNARPAVRAVFAIGTSLLTDAAWGSIVFGLFVVTGGWLVGSGRRATVLRRVSAPALREHATAFRVGLGLLLLLLVAWGPVPWTRSFWPLLVFAIAAFVWLERVRRVTLAEFGDVPAGELGRSVRERWARRPGQAAQPGAG
ncbi:MAG TPA: hypothetical protein VF024_12560 [Solirubrobacteraceae bacterium]